MTDTDRKIMLIGDAHGNEPWLYQTVFPRAIEAGVSRIVALGDWGMFFTRGTQPMDRVNSNAARLGLEVYFLDGNHENFDLMEDFGFFTSADAYKGNAPGESLDDISEIGPIGPIQNTRWGNISYLPRGSTFRYGGYQFMAFGGAVSIDKEWRVEGESWWPQELITDEQVQWVRDHPVKVDILLTHDVAGHPPRLMDFCNRNFRVPYKLDAISHNNRERLYEVLQVVRPDANVHGHYHYPYADRLDLVDYLGLGRDGHSGSITILDPKNQPTNESENTQP